MASQTHLHSQPDVLSSEVMQSHVTMDEEMLDPGEEDEPAPQAKFTDDKASDKQPQKTSEKSQLPHTTDGREKTTRGHQEFVLLAEECRAHIQRLFTNDSDLCSLNFGDMVHTLHSIKLHPNYKVSKSPIVNSIPGSALSSSSIPPSTPACSPPTYC